jgi:hypothetical protein
MTTSASFIPHIFIAFTFVFYGLSGIANAQPDHSSKRRANPELSKVKWQGGPSATAKAKRADKRAAKKAKQAERKGKRANKAKRSARKGKRANKAQKHVRKQERKQQRRARRLAKFDANQDGKLGKVERTQMKRVRLARLDKNKDGVISRGEKRAAKAKRRRARRGKNRG